MPRQPELILTILVGLFGLLAAYLAYRLKRKQRIVEYDVYSMPLTWFEPLADRGLWLTANKSLLTGNPADGTEPVRIDSAYGFRIDLRNVGNSPIEKPHVEITMDDHSNILEFSTDPTDRPGFPVEKTDTAKRNVLLLSFPYLNPKESISIGITSTGNEEPKCDVSMLGAGIRTISITSRRRFWLRIALSFTLITAIGEALSLLQVAAKPGALGWPAAIIAVLFLVIFIGIFVKTISVVAPMFEPGLALVRSRSRWPKHRKW